MALDSECVYMWFGDVDLMYFCDFPRLKRLAEGRRGCIKILGSDDLGE